MSAENPPTYNFPGIQFNPSFFDNENNISQYEADNTYLKKPINQNIGLLNSILTLTNVGTPKESSWTIPVAAITNYVNYDSVTSSLISNVSGTPTTITSINTTGTLQSRGLTIKNASNTDVSTISIAGAITGTSLSAGTGTISTSGAINGGAITGTSLSGGNGLISTTNSLQSRGLTVKNTSNADVCTISNLGALVCTSIQNNNNTLNCGNITSGTINSGAINANANLIETTGNIQSRGLTIKNVSNTNVLTISNVGDINVSGAYSGANYIYTSSGDIQTASGDIYTNTGELRSRRLVIKNTSDAIVATISNLGALVCTTIQNNNNTLNCGNITSGTINSGAINANTNLIETTGGLQSRGLAIRNTSNADVATISNLGALVCTSIQNNNNTLNCGNITSGTINSGAINANTNLIETTGGLQSRGLAIRNTSNADVATISNLGALVCTSINSSSGLVQTTGNLQSRGLTIKDTSNSTVATISNLGVLTCFDIINGGMLTSRGLTIKNNLNVDVATITTDGILTCKEFQNNGNTLYCGDITCGSINSGSSTITGYNLVSTISVTAPAINSSAPNLNIIIGGTQTSGRIDIGNNTSRTGAINIATTVTGNQNINIGNSSSTQTININRPIRLPGLLYTSGSEIGYTQNDAVFFSTGSGNPVIPNTRMNTQITATNLINNANYMIKYSLLIVPQANFNVTRFQYGLYDTGFMTSLSQNPTALSGTTTTLRFDTSDVYSYSGSGFFRYDNTKTYNLSFIMAFLATAPNVQTNIDLIRIS